MPTKTKRKPKTLAHVKKLSTLLAIGLRDLRKQERAKNSIVDMRTWLHFNSKCSACLAGSVLRFSLGYRTDAEPWGRCDASKLTALNELRAGNIPEAAARMDVKTKLGSRYYETPSYDGPNGEWWKAMKSLLKELKEAGE